MNTEKEILAEVKRNLHPSTTRQNTCLAIIAFTIVIPAMTIWGSTGLVAIFGFLRELPLAVLFVISSVGGAVALAFWYPDPNYRMLGVIPGILLGLGVFAALFLYTSFRQNVLLAELLIPMLAGGAPGYLLYNFLVKRKALRNDRNA